MIVLRALHAAAVLTTDLLVGVYIAYVERRDREEATP